jgi:hypothetical protein
VPVFFSALTPGQHVREATEWFIRKLGIEEPGPPKVSRSPSSVLTEHVAIPDTWRLFPSASKEEVRLPREAQPQSRRQTGLTLSASANVTLRVPRQSGVHPLGLSKVSVGLELGSGESHVVK